MHARSYKKKKKYVPGDCCCAMTQSYIFIRKNPSLTQTLIYLHETETTQFQYQRKEE